MRSRGFTLIELLVVLAIVATLLALAVPRYFGGLERSKEAALRQTLLVVRDAIDKYNSDTGRYPGGLDDLVTKQYLRRVPVDPITESTSTWVTVPAAADATRATISDLKSGAPGTARDGTAYVEW